MKHRVFLLLIAFMLPALSMRGQHDTEEQLRALTHAWNDAHTAARLAELEPLYAYHLHLYGTMISPSRAVRLKKGYLKNHPGFTQRIDGDIKVERLTDAIYRSSFSKITLQDGKESVVQGLLYFRKDESDEWNIYCESDDVTNKRLKSRVVKEFSFMAKPESEEDIISCLLFSTQMYRNAKKDYPGMHVRIMFDSTPDDGESSTYSARLFLDSDDAPRIETLGFFSYDIKERKCYLYRPGYNDDEGAEEYLDYDHAVELFLDP